MTTATDGKGPRTLEFKTELKQLLDIIVHSLYSEKEIFLRELISNACDAIDKIRFESLTRPDLVEGDGEWKIELVPDAEQGTLTVRDNGIGMTAETIVDDLGTIARSGTREFLHQLQQADREERPGLIGQFGVGFYSAYMVADKVTVVSRAAGADAGVKWESDGQGKFTVEPVQKDGRGTDVVLHLKDDAREFLQPHRLRSVVKRYSDFVEHPIVMEVEKEQGQREEETLNSRKALWLKTPSEVTESEYHEFYKQISRDFEDPAHTIHFSAEGTLDFKALLFLPRHRPLDFQWGEPHVALHLYVQRVFIMAECDELLPMYLRFVKGVVDSSDLPLNVSREMLQQNKVLTKVRRALVNKVLRTLEEMKENDREAYESFYREFGPTLKEGLSQDPDNRNTLADLLLVESTTTDAGQFTTLAEVLERMPEEQPEIYYLIGDTRRAIEGSPYVEAARDKGYEVLLLTDPIDEFVVSVLSEYEGKPLKGVDRADLSLDEEASAHEELEPLFEYLKSKLPEVQDVRESRRLRESAACLVVEEGHMGAHLERLMARMGRAGEMPSAPRILELNGEHPAVRAMHRLFAKSPDDSRLEAMARLLYESAVLAEGTMVPDPPAMARRIHELIEVAGAEED